MISARRRSGRQARRGAADDLRADREVAEHPALLGEPELRAVGVLARPADVVDDRRRHQQVGVEAGMKRAGLEHERRDGDRVLEQAPEVGVMGRAGAGRTAKVGGQRTGEDDPGDRVAQWSVVDLAREVLEKAVELLDRPIGGGQELLGLVAAGLEAARIVDLDHQLASEASRPCRARRSRRLPRTAGRSGRHLETRAPATVPLRSRSRRDR